MNNKKNTTKKGGWPRSPWYYVILSALVIAYGAVTSPMSKPPPLSPEAQRIEASRQEAGIEYQTEKDASEVGTVYKYDAITAAAISPNFITGLNEPVGLAVLGNTLFAANLGDGTVGKYDATTGAAISPSFITGLNGPDGLAVSGNTSSWRTKAMARLANTTPKPEPRLAPASSQG